MSSDVIESYPIGFNALPSAPAIIILDHKFRIKYRWEHPQISENPIQDFNLLAWDISAGINTDVGEASITIQDHESKLTNNDNRAGPAIAAGDLMQISLGKNNIEPWFFGICDEPTIRRGGNNQQYIIIKAIGYGITLAHRFVNLDYAQELDDAGDIVDTDNTAKISELIKRVLTDYDIVALPPPDQNIVIDIDDMDIKIRRYKKNNRSQAAVISELANFGNAIFGIDANLRFFCHAPNKPSDYTITNNLELNLDVNKMMIIRNQSYDYTDSTVRGAFTSLIGTDVTQVTTLIDDNKGTDSVDIGQTYDLFGFSMYQGKIDGSLRFYADKSINSVGNNTLYWYIIEVHSAVFRIYDVINRDDMPLDRTDNVVAYGTISNLDTLLPVQNITRPIELDINLPATQRNRYIAFYHTDGVNIKYLNSGSGFRYGAAYFQTQDTGTVGTIRLTIPSEQGVLLKAQNTTLKHQQTEKEQIQNFRNAPNNQTATQIFEGVMDSAGRVRRTYTGIVTSIPPEKPPVGQLYRIIDKHQNLDTHALCIGYDIGSDLNNNLNAISMSVDLEEWLE